MVGAVAFQEPEHDTALALTGDAELHAPTLLDYELASVACTKIRRDTQQRPIILTLLGAALATGVQRHEVNLSDAAELAVETGLSAYDACYLLLARRLGAELVTFDRQLAEAARQAS